MKRIRIETGVDVRRWDTYELDVPDDFDGDSEFAEAYLARTPGLDWVARYSITKVPFRSGSA